MCTGKGSMPNSIPCCNATALHCSLIAVLLAANTHSLRHEDSGLFSTTALMHHAGTAMHEIINRSQPYSLHLHNDTHEACPKNKALACHLIAEIEHCLCLAGWSAAPSCCGFMLLTEQASLSTGQRAIAGMC